MKRLLILAVSLAMLLALCACGGGSGSGSQAKEIDLDALAAELMDSGAFTDILSQPADGVAARLYDFEDGDVTKYVMYTGTGATAEEIFLAQAANGDAASALKTACEQRVENQKLAFRSYAPGEVEKLDAAVIAVSGNYVILVISADAAAVRGIVESYT